MVGGASAALGVLEEVGTGLLAEAVHPARLAP
jgi:hypothetical protein